MRIGSLFAGIGGFDLAAESLGWSTAWVSEIDPVACAVLAKHFPDAPNLGDVTLIDWSQVEPIDILCGGFPCQPHSLAGKRAASGDERDLWSECVRAVGVLRPRYAVFENVPGLLTSESGRFFNRVVSDLAACGYAVEWSTLSASDVGAPHKRERIWIVAYATDADEQERERGSRGERGDPLQHLRCCSGVGAADRAGPQGHGSEPGGLAVPAGRERARRLAGPSNRAVRDWSDAIPYRGADGTVRLIPAAAVAHNEVTGREASRPDGLRDADGSRGDEGLAASENGTVRGAVEVPRPEPPLRALADGLPDQLLRRDRGAEEAEPWPTPDAGAFGASSDPVATNNRRARIKAELKNGNGFGLTTGNATAAFGGDGGSLWPVTASEPGRVARLRAVGNAIVPLCAVEGPFRRILELEAEL